MTEDVPSPIDLRLPSDAKQWEQLANSRRPWRIEFFERFVNEIKTASPSIHRVLELGSGPGFLAEHLLRSNNHIECVLLDFSVPMHELAKARLSEFAMRTTFVERSFKEPDWTMGLGTFDCVVTNQAVHELRHKRYALQLHTEVRMLLSRTGIYLVCDHFYGEGGMTDDQLYMTIDEQKQTLLAAGFTSVDQLMVKGGMVLHRAM